VDLSVKDEAAARASECQVLEPGANWDNVLDGRKGSAFEAALTPSEAVDATGSDGTP
jgi:hypothetical protein